MNTAIQLTTAAWLLRGISSIPGQLKLSGGRLSFKAQGSGSAWKHQLRKLERHARQPGLADRLDGDQAALVFDLPLAELSVKFPWYYFSGGLIVKSAGSNYRFSFGRPSDGPGGRALEQLQQIGTMRALGKAWKAALIKA